MARYMRTDLGSGHSKLKAPAVVGEGIVFPPIEGYLFPISDVQTRIRKHTIWRLEPPVVVNQPQPFVASPVAVTLAPSTQLPRAPHSRLRPPVVIDLTPQTRYLSVNLTYSRRGVPKSRLFPPTDTVGLEDQGKIRVRLAPSPRQARGPHSRLRPPVVIDLSPQTRYLSVNLTYSRRGTPRSRLGSPAVVAAVAQIYYGPRATLVRARPRRALSFLRPPVIPPVARPTVVILTKARPRRVESTLRPPTVVFLAVEIYGPTVRLSYSARKRGVAAIKPPTVIDVRVYSGPTVTLAYSVHGRPLYALRPPVVIDDSPQTYYLAINLAYSRRGRPTSALRPPVVVDVRVYSGPSVTLAYSRRGTPIYALRPPEVIDLRPQVYYVTVSLAPSRRGRPIHFLRPAVLAAAKQFEAVSVHLAYSVRKRGRAVLRRPVVVFPFFARPPIIALAPHSRGRTHSQLFPPAVVRERESRPIRITLAPSLRGQPKSFLSPPTVVFPFFARRIDVTFAPQARGRTRSLLASPAVVREFAARPVQITLAKIRPQPTTSFLKPPTVVTTPEPVLYPVAVTLAYSLRGKPVYFLRPPQILIFVPDRGDICGFDIAASFICFDEEAGSVDSGATAAGSTIVGDDQQDGNISGGDQPGSTVLGSDQQAT